MGKKNATEHPEALALENAAWDLKSLAEQFHSRAMTGETRAVLASALRDLKRVKENVSAEWERRCGTHKRAPKAEAQQPLLGEAKP